MLAFLVATAAALACDPALAAPTPTQRCEAAFETALGKATLCRLAAEAAFTRSLDAAKRSTALGKCSSKLADALGKATSKFGSACPTTPPVSAFDDFVAACSDGAASGSSGGNLPALKPCAAGTIAVGGGCWLLGAVGETCDQACALAGLAYDDATAAEAGSGGSLAQCADVLNALSLGTGIPISVVTDFDCNLQLPVGGVGCGQDGNIVLSQGTRCFAPATTSTASFAGARRACACQ